MSATLLRYFSALPRAAIDRLYSDGWTCQGLLRALPPLARQYVLRLACAQGQLPARVVHGWAQQSREAHAKHSHALEVLRRLNIVQEVRAGDGDAATASFRLHDGFAVQLLESLCVGGVLDADSERDTKRETEGDAVGKRALAEEEASSSPPTLAQLERHATTTWERVLQALRVQSLKHAVVGPGHRVGSSSRLSRQ